MPNGSAPRRRPVFTPKRNWRGRQIRFVRNRVVIRLEDTGKAVQEIERQLDSILEGIGLTKSYRHVGDVVVVDIEDPRDADAVDRDLLAHIDRLKRRSGIRFVEPDLRLSPLALPEEKDNDNPADANGEQWGWLHIGMEDAWQANPGSSDVFIAILDTALYQHSDLDDTNIEATINIEEPGTSVFSNVVADAGHGTRVCGIVAAGVNNHKGVSGINTVSPVRYYRTDVPDEMATTATNLLEAVRYVIDEAEASNRKAVVNISWGADLQLAGTDPAHTEALGTLTTMCDEAEESGDVLLCCGAGNHQGDTQWPARFAGDVTYTCVIAVGATSLVAPTPGPGEVLPLERSTALTSSYADEYLWGSTPSDLNVTVVAPGDNLEVLAITPPEVVNMNGVDNRDLTDVWDGTSLAVGFVTGAASLLWSAAPTLVPAGVVSALKLSASQADGLPTPAAGWGHGRINVPLGQDSVLPVPVVDAIMDLSMIDRKKLDSIAEIIKEWLAILGPRVDIDVLGPDGLPGAARLDELIATGSIGVLGTPEDLDTQVEAALEDVLHRRKNPTVVPRQREIVMVTDRDDHSPVSHTLLDRLSAAGTRVHSIRTQGTAASDALESLVTATGGTSSVLDVSSETTVVRHKMLSRMYEIAGWFAVESAQAEVTVSERSASVSVTIPASCTLADFLVSAPTSCTLTARISVDGHVPSAGEPGFLSETGDGTHVVRITPGAFRRSGEWRYQVSIDHDAAVAYTDDSGGTTIPLAILVAGNNPGGGTDIVID